MTVSHNTLTPLVTLSTAVISLTAVTFTTNPSLSGGERVSSPTVPRLFTAVTLTHTISPCQAMRHVSHDAD